MFKKLIESNPKSKYPHLNNLGSYTLKRKKSSKETVILSIYSE
jgi:hypothetical protein